MKHTDGYPNAHSHERLRASARDLIDHGVPPPHRGGNLSVDALQLLYERASSPASAADAVKLLHELQTYQVELDLLYEQLQANEHELSEELLHYKSLYEQAPAAYLTMANDGEIIEGNQAAGELFGQPAAELAGKALSGFLAPGQDKTLNTLLRHPEAHSPAMHPVALPDHRYLMLNARPAESGDSILVILTEAAAPP
ncbi:PAS domain S-box protein [Marinobacter subterrani]|uniref:PAS domain S-box n=1 Tax=Marinobacter subterrani TaxID=1658765 RepID=A0A0J7J4B6_9GAMM|nr:PAS domain S-box protein [Marinobacter subterrani]KMQ72839.1 PAS domain S-box [Marinobacter subterrani]